MRSIPLAYGANTSLPWDVPRALAELIANALDEDDSAVLKLGGNTLTIRNTVKDDKPGLTLDSFTVTSTKDAGHGKFGYGLKDALVVLVKNDIGAVASSRAGRFTFDPKRPRGPNNTVEYGFDDREEMRCKDHETVFVLQPVTDDAIAKAKLYFAKFCPDLKEPVGEIVNRFQRKLRIFENPSGQPRFFINGFFYKYSSSEEKKKFFFAYDIGYDRELLKSRDRDQLPNDWSAKVTAYMKSYATLPTPLLARLVELFSKHKDGKAFWEFGRSEFGDAAAYHGGKLASLRAEQEALFQQRALEARKKEEQAAALRVQLAEIHALSRDAAAQEGSEDGEFVTRQKVLEDDAGAKEKQITNLENTAKALRAQLLPADGPIMFTAQDAELPATVPPNAQTLALPHAVIKRLPALAPDLRSCDSVNRAALQKALQALCSHLALGVHVSVAAVPEFAQFHAAERKLLLSDAAMPADDKVLTCALSKLWQHYYALNFNLGVEWLGKLVPLLPAPSRALSAPPAERPRENLRILFICDEWGTKFGGISAANFQMAREFALLPAVEVCVLISDTKSELTDVEIEGALRDDKVTLLFPTMERRKIVAIRGCPAIDVVVAHGEISGPLATTVKHLPQFATARFWLFNHTDPEGVDPYKPEGASATTADAKIAKMMPIVAQFHAIFSFGSLIYNAWQRSYEGHNVKVSHHVYYPPLNPLFFRQALPTAASGDAIRILLFGRVGDATNWFKGVDIACAAAKLLAKRLGRSKQVELVVRGIPADQLHQQFVNLLQSTDGVVKILPRQYGFQEDIKKDLHSSDVCIVPARYEPYGLTGLEAIAARTPIFVSANTGFAVFLREFVSASDLVVNSTYDMTSEAAAERFADAMYETAFSSPKQMDQLRRRMARLHDETKSLFAARKDVHTYEDLAAFARTSALRALA